MKILIVSDAWHPQINGVVRSIEATQSELEKRGHQVVVIGPDQFWSVPMPSYPEIRLAPFARKKLWHMIDNLRPGAIHIATEGPLGWFARAYCLKHAYLFSTSYHTQFPYYIRKRFPIPLGWSFGVLRKFHAPSSAVLVSVDSIKQELTKWHFKNLAFWKKAVDTDVFKPGDKNTLNVKNPVYLYVGRVAVEKNIEDFLKLDLPGTKIVVGDGPQLNQLKQKYPAVQFAGVKTGAELVQYYNEADVFVFPSKTDTFGLVILEALACGVPVAAYPVPGPQDVIGTAPVGALHENLAVAIEQALKIPPEQCRAFALQHSWASCAQEFLQHLPAIVRD